MLRKRNNRAKGSRVLESLESRQLMAGHTAADCIDFEDLTVGDTYIVGDNFTADPVDFQADITGRAFQWSSGAMFAGGMATVESGNSSGHAGQDIAVNNINLDFRFSDDPVNDLTLHFGEYGGNLNLTVNGDFVNFEDFQDINGAVLGGTTISVPVGGTGQDTGVLQIHGPVHQFAVGGQELWIDHICRGIEDDNPRGDLDFGDAPDRPYPTLTASNGAAHVINPDVFLGRRVDAEPDGQPSPAANRDDANPSLASDDEDGVRFLTPLVPGETAEVEVIASTDGFLNAWIDFDRDGVWANGSAENIFSAEPLVAGPNILSFNVPATALPAPNDATFSRWRFSTTHKLLNPDATVPPGEADRIPNGEVEDHLAFIHPEREPVDRFDFGDAPERPYPVTLANGGARHRIDPDVFLGRTVDRDPDGQPSANANRDDGDSAIDDEDGVRFLTPLIPGQNADVEVIASTDGWLNAWIDFDRDGVWNPGSSDEIFVGEALVPGANVLTFHVPADAKPGPNEPTYSRWRFSSTDKVLTPKEGSPDGSIPNGEVEDHLAFIQEAPRPALDFGDAPEDPYPVTLANNGAYHQIDPEVYLGRLVDGEPDGQPSPNANRDDVNSVTDDEDGIRFLTALTPGQSADVEVIASADGWLNAWIDFDRDGVWSPGSSDEIFFAQPVNAGVNVLAFHVPADAKPTVNEATVSRWRFSTSHKELTPEAGAPDGTRPNGEVEDHLVRIRQVPDNRFDFGDLRDSYGTTLGSNGARHVISPNVFLGALIDAELDGQPSFNAQRDDSAVSDDEDGVRFVTSMVPGKIAVVDVLSSADARLDAWVDFNQNGTFDSGEQALSSVVVTAGLNRRRFEVPDRAFPAPTQPAYLRFRLSTAGGLTPTGPARDGEVEDYAVLNGDFNNNLTIEVSDVDALCNHINGGSPTGDLNNDGTTNGADMDYLIHNILGTHYGDANLDQIFNSADLVLMFSAGEYEDGIPGNSTWAEGDFNCDGEFDSSDIVKAFADGGYSNAAVPRRSSDPAGHDPIVDREIGAAGETNDAEVHELAKTPVQRRLIEPLVIEEIFANDIDRNDTQDAGSQDARDRIFAMME